MRSEGLYDFHFLSDFHPTLSLPNNPSLLTPRLVREGN